MNTNEKAGEPPSRGVVGGYAGLAKTVAAIQKALTTAENPTTVRIGEQIDDSDWMVVFVATFQGDSMAGSYIWQLPASELAQRGNLLFAEQLNGELHGSLEDLASNVIRKFGPEDKEREEERA